MPNRIIKESICKSETLNLLTAEEERLFYRLIVNCDDYGRFDANPAIVRNSCFKLDDGKIKIDRVDTWLNKLSVVGLIILYENSGKRYFEFATWQNHQQTRANKSKYPSPYEEGSKLIASDNICNQMNLVLAKSDRTRIRISNTNTKEGGMGGDSKSGKVQFAENVSMTNAEYDKLVGTYGEANTKQMIEKLDNYKGSSGKRYKSDYRTILNWVVGEVMKNAKPKDAVILE